MRCLLAAAMLALLAPLPATAAPLYVDNMAGDDRYDGRAPQWQAHQTGPVRTIGRALELALPADRIVIANTGVPYRESLSLSAGNHSGWSEQPFVIDGNGAALDGSQAVPPRLWEHHRGDIFRFRPARGRFQQLFLDGKPLTRVAVDAASGRLPELEPLQWCLHQGAIHFRAEAGKLPDRYPLAYAALPVGITLHNVRHVFVLDLIVQGYQLDGVHATGGASMCRLGGLTCRGNGRAGVAVTGDARIWMDGCLVGDNGAAQLLADGLSITVVEGCELLGETAPAVVRDGGEVIVDGQPQGQ